MRHFLALVLKLTLAAFIALLIIFLAYYITCVVYGGSIVTAMLVIGAIFAIAIVTYLAIHYFRRYRQKKFVEQIIAQDDLIMQRAKNEELSRLSDLRQRWISAVDTLKGSTLSKMGNPLYVLPWYLIIGETDAGKSSCIANAGLSSITSEVGPIPGIASTRNCDWWFFNNAIVIDTAGKYVRPVDGKIDESEWKEFLVQLGTYRRREPINGIMVTLPAEKFLSDRTDDLEQYAVFVADRLNRLTNVLGAKVPVYLTITKADLIAGFSSLGELLTDEEKDQSFGYSSDTVEGHNMVVEKFVESVESYLRKLILSVPIIESRYEQGLKAKAGIKLFAENISEIRSKLRSFIQIAFDNTTYNEEVILRGIYLTSALQKGNTISPFLSEKVKSEDSHRKFDARGLFIKQLFTTVMPRDRLLYEPINSFSRWRNIAANLSILSVGIITLLTIGFFSYGMYRCEQWTVNIGDAVFRLQDSQKKPNYMLDAIIDLRNHLNEVQTSSFYHIIPDFISTKVDASIEAGNIFTAYVTLKKMLYKSIHPWWIAEMYDRTVNNEMLSPEEAERVAYEFIGDGVLTQASIIDFFDKYKNQRMSLKEALQTLDDLEKTRCFDFAGNSVPGTICTSLWKDSIATLVHHESDEFLYITAMDALAKIINSYDDLDWIIEWANNKSQPVKSNAFLPFLSADRSTYTYDFEAAFTKDGVENMKTLANKLPKDEKFSKQNGVHLDIPSHLESLRKLVYMNFQTKWINFMEHFNESTSGLPINDRLSALSLMGEASTNPFFKVAARSLEELSYVSELGGKVDLQSLKLQVDASSQYKHIEGEGNSIEKIKANTKAHIDNIIGNINNPDGEEQTQLLDVVRQTNKFFETVNNIIPLLSNRNLAFNSVKASISGAAANNGQGSKEDPFMALEKSLLNLKSLLVKAEDRAYANHMTPSGYAAYSNTATYLKQLSMDLVACQIQHMWTDKVVSKVLHSADISKLPLFGDNGLVTDFVTNSLGALISEDVAGYESPIWFDRSLPYTQDFLTFLNSRDSYIKMRTSVETKLTLTTAPAEVNDDATIMPIGTRLTFICDDQQGDQVLESYNYKKSLSFKWNIDHCKEAKLEVLFDGYTISKNFDGDYGSVDLISKFVGGLSTKFSAGDFETDQLFLDEHNIDWIDMRMNVKGDRVLDVIKNANFRRSNMTIPQQAIVCKDK